MRILPGAGWSCWRSGCWSSPALAQMLMQTPVQSPSELARHFRSSWTGMVLLAPFEVFSHTIMAPRVFPDLVCWGAGSLAIDALLLALIFKLDADYLESAAAISQKLYEKSSTDEARGRNCITDLAEGGEHPAGAGFPGSEAPVPWRGGRS